MRDEDPDKGIDTRTAYEAIAWAAAGADHALMDTVWEHDPNDYQPVLATEYHHQSEIPFECLCEYTRPVPYTHVVRRTLANRYCPVPDHRSR